MGSQQHASNRGRPSPGWLIDEDLVALLCEFESITMADLARVSYVGASSLRATMRRRVGPPDGYALFEGGRHKEAYWTSERLRVAVRDLLIFETRQGRYDLYRARKTLARLGVDFEP